MEKRRRHWSRTCLGVAIMVLALSSAWSARAAFASCPETYTVICDGWCCEKGFTCGTVTQCCIPQEHGEECPSGSCAYCPVQYPDCVGWAGSNYTCCVESAIRCNIGDDVWCCDVWESCGTKVGHCTTG